MNGPQWEQASLQSGLLSLTPGGTSPRTCLFGRTGLCGWPQGVQGGVLTADNLLPLHLALGQAVQGAWGDELPPARGLFWFQL